MYGVSETLCLSCNHPVFGILLLQMLSHIGAGYDVSKMASPCTLLPGTADRCSKRLGLNSSIWEVSYSCVCPVLPSDRFGST